jgi:uncharacterized protein YecE (DUF72 family)
MTDFNRSRVAGAIASLAGEGVLVGTSSWKYPGWCGTLYEEGRYHYRGKFTKSRFERNCLAEYSEVFKTVCIDAAYYAFPTEDYLERLASQVPADFKFALKITDEITLKNFPNLPRFGARAGRANPAFLDAEAFQKGFLDPCERIKEKIGLLIFEFSRFYPNDFAHGREFLEVLDAFLGKLPAGWPYALELRNKYWLKPEYFACLSGHHIAHVYNSWTEMPPVSEQINLPGSQTNPDLVAARFLLKPGRKYEEAVRAFSPYTRALEAFPEARLAGSSLIKQGKLSPGKRTFILVNNRLEGSALETITAMLAGAGEI